MARTIPKGLSRVLEELELERPQLVTTSQLAELCERAGIRTPAKVVASRLRERGWLLPTTQRGVWEFAPAELAGAYSSADPLLPLKALAAARANERFALASQTAAWALGLADRAPAVLDAAFEQAPASVPEGVCASTYRPNVPTATAKGVAALAPESIVVHMVQRPSAVRSWQGVAEWLPDVAYELDAATMLKELEGRPRAAAVRTGYLLQGMRPDVADAIMEGIPPRSKTRFGAGAAKRNDERWQVSDATLPFDPREMKRAL
ncbi:type IV toxin-antitoxin system AbiEi family antitoxin [Adlercreutzia sp. ZJ242]|uniref:type IV toxin-antitoxin system AbiEi family antitoxin n=1 Tax=Adlercreutzia sp. ZJ242 TaxID=2709409 RepID=UPI0013ECC985|nr:type IV toxin-antitoxin system AbiEi family antitoxin [Adlercreutzia sp. ZJ242]